MNQASENGTVVILIHAYFGSFSSLDWPRVDTK